ncbi:DUF3019 domain-containing protein [Pseudoalteromonas shioyasakiensis]|uniref:DUF3019 domain-containing protein n=1 Tax=Pseudoalteromonas TaxID=53246 RepID=UPI00259A8F31|nr:DUF3019 domain-containing protein [Pseudoalteromonas shioyasakiensis]MCO6354652.1 DUF3019 domain-containing protein [Pseudoalteromonas shioyasakiensis]
MINRFSWLLLFFCLCFSSLCLSDDSPEQPFFKVSPTVCVTDAKQKACEFNIQIHFRVAPFKELCLEVTQRPQYTQCYKQGGLIIEKLTVKTEHPLTVKLIDPLSNQVVKQQLLSIASYEAKDYRIKRRFGWSL